MLKVVKRSSMLVGKMGLKLLSKQKEQRESFTWLFENLLYDGRKKRWRTFRN